MLTATLGGLIKDYRIKKRLSQQDISLKIGWKDTTRLSKIEQGRVGKPTRETVEKIIKALELTEQEKGEFLLIGGYIATDDEVRIIVSQVKSKLDNWSYPAYLMDFSFRIVYTNLLNLKVLELDSKWQKVIEKNKPNVMVFPFLPRDQFPVTVLKGEDVNSLKSFQIAQIATFKTETYKYQSESWYNKIVQELMSNVDFRELWAKIDQKDYHKKFYDYEFKRIESKYNEEKKTLNFHIYTTKLINDPRFQLVLYYPADNQTQDLFKEVRA